MAKWAKRSHPLFLVLVVFLLTPTGVALAQGANNLNGLVGQIVDLINNSLVPLVFALAFIVFIWGVFQYFIAGAADETKRENGKNLMIYGLIGFFVMASVWGIVNLLVNTFGLDISSGFNLPEANK